MRGLVLNHHHSYTFSFFFVVLVLFRPLFSANTLSPTETLAISSNRTIVSPGNIFEFGFFKITTNSRDVDRWYLGIWYKASFKRTIVWVANRDNPLSSSIGIFKISNTNLVLLDHSDTPVWSTNLTKAVKYPLVAELLATGNFVLRDSKTNDPDQFLWQSFDFPTDTLLPEMKLGRNLKTGHDKFLRSWKSPNDPSSGDSSFKLETGGLPEFYLRKGEFILYRSGPWNGVRFSGIPKMQNWSYIVSNFTENREDVAYSFKVTNHNIHSRFTMSSTGSLDMFTWISTVPKQNMFWLAPEGECDLYNMCGPYGYCDTETSPICNCIRGFVPRNSTAWALGGMFDGCVRRSPPLSCDGDGVLLMKGMKLPVTTSATVDRTIGSKECKEKCIRDCNCTGFANTDIRNGGSGCVIWTGELVDMRRFIAGGQDFYVRIPATSLPYN